MSDAFLDMLTNTEQFKKKGFEKDNYIKKPLRDGDNRFRIKGRGRVFYVHNFHAVNGVAVRSICEKDEDGNGSCEVCEIWNSAWKVMKAVKEAIKEGTDHGYSREQIEKAEMIVGERIDPLRGFKQSWGPKKSIAYNVIDRDSDINKRENHTSLLTKSEYDLGISAGPKGIYEQVVKLLARYREEIKKHFATGADYLPFDINLIRSGKKLDTDYDKERGEAGPLTKEEINMPMYNLAEVCKPTPKDIVKRWLTTGTKKGSEEETPVEGESEEYNEDAQEEQNTQEVNEQPEERKEETKAAPASAGFQKRQPPATKKEPPKEDVAMDDCPECGKRIPITSKSCPFCKTEFAGYNEESAKNPY